MAPTQGPHEHGRFDYSAIVDRKPLRWPNGARVAVWVIPNIEYFWFDRPGVRMSGGGGAQLNPDVLNFSWRDYGVRVGIWRMMEIMERYGVRGTVALNSEVCAHYPRIIEAGKIAVPIDRTFPLADAVAAQARMRANEHFGKIVLTIGQ